MEEEEAEKFQFPAVDQVMQMKFRCPRSNIRLSAAVAIATSVAEALSL
jgi:hypothetical protein